jgi:hypothetical protein
MLKSFKIGNTCKELHPPSCKVTLNYETKSGTKNKSKIKNKNKNTTETKYISGYEIRNLYKELGIEIDDDRLINFPGDEKLKSFIVFPDKSGKIDKGFIKELWDFGIVFSHMWSDKCSNPTTRCNQDMGIVCIVALGSGQNEAVKYIDTYGNKDTTCFIFIEDAIDNEKTYPKPMNDKCGEGMYVCIGDNYEDFDRPEIMKEIYYVISNTNGGKLSWFQTSSAMRSSMQGGNYHLNDRYKNVYKESKLAYYNLEKLYKYQ